MDLKQIYSYTISRNIFILRKSGIKTNAKLYIGLTIFGSIIIPLLFNHFMHLNIKTTFILFLVYLGVFLSIPSIIYEGKIEKFEKNIPKALYVMTLSLDSGRSVTEAIEEVINAGVNGVDKEFMKILYLIIEKKYSFEDAMTTITENSDSMVFRQIGRLIIENRKQGGELASTLRTLAKTLEDLMNIKQQLLSTTANGLVVGLVILCGVIPATAGLIGGYLTVLSTMSPNMPAPSPEQIAKCYELIQLGTGIFGLLFSIPLFGLNLSRMIITCAICMTGGIVVFYGISMGSGFLFS
ncbi:type II secretion system F family protein [Methanococcus aeolicus]|uniref:Type II secretion system protein n=1 Tax=Methanococcus aeolicus (strain ATCC BAA-1280 / DSM 17508 / OCM 812 / Nankai-3) TaxID=419665 RepID=A6UW57_META3|nr:type II secretion system F family protein [Methanococcus aeolicus]ABR56729.1 type II secretion system protein [Methanococcus aeolicus Nankai-3]UXM84730.1 type II secretion system F family protein [Methanococcus aeolicus]